VQTVGLQVVLEDNPKWQLFLEVVNEIADMVKSPQMRGIVGRGPATGAVALVLTKDDHTTSLLEQCLHGDQRGHLKQQLQR
jgi:hypothetical protein